MSVVLALDQGTSSSRAIVYDPLGVRLATVQKPTRTAFPVPGRVEQDPEDLFQAQLACAREALEVIGVTGQSVAAVGIANQRETTIVWSRRSGQALHPAIVWQDRRTVEWCERQRALGLLDSVRDRTGLVIDPYFSASKIVWLLDRVPGARRLAEAGDLAFGTVDSWLVWRLTGGERHVTDATNASRTMLYNIHEGRWDPALCSAFGIPPSMLPEVLPSAATFGTTALFGDEVPILGCAGDQQAALFGQGCVRAGQAKNTYGTGCFLLMHTASDAVASRRGMLTTAAAQRGDIREYALEGAVFDAGSAVQWLRDGLAIIESDADIEPLAKQVDDTGGVFLVPAFNGLGSPHWNAGARGALVGITRGTNRAHVARAALESIALQSTEVLQAMKDDAQIALDELRVDGGAASNDLLMQMQADLLGVPVIRPHDLEATAFGAASLAAHAAGLREFGTGAATGETRFEPTISAADASLRLDRWREAVERTKDWAR